MKALASILVTVGLALGSGCNEPSAGADEERTRVPLGLHGEGRDAADSAGALVVPASVLERVERTNGGEVTLRFRLPRALDLSPYDRLVLDVETASPAPRIVATHAIGPRRYRWSDTDCTWPAGGGEVRLPLPIEARARIDRMSIAFQGDEAFAARVRSWRFERASDLEEDEGSSALFDDGTGERRRGWLLGPDGELEASAVPPAGDGRRELTFSVALFAAEERASAGLDVELETLDGVAREPVSIDGARDWRFVRLPLPSGGDGEVRVRFRARVADLARLVVAEPALTTVRADAPTIVLITSDTHRGDHVGTAARPADVRTPNLDALADRGVRFVDCTASTNITVPSHVALFTGSTPHATGVQDNQSSVSARASTLAERFARAGFATVAVTSLNLLQPEHCGLGQGFERYTAAPETWTAEQAVERLSSAWPDLEGRPVFCWLHVFDAHGPYTPAPELVQWPIERESRSVPQPEGARLPDWAAIQDVEFVRALYRGEVAAVDRALAPLLARPRVRAGVVAFTSDHGESLGQHGIWWAHKNVYRDTLHVPLLLAGPPGLAGRVIEEPVRQIDLGRTLLDLAGVDAPGFGGRNLLEALERPGTGERRFALAGGASAAAVSDGRWHLVTALTEDGELGRTELFDLETDPSGETDVSVEEPERTARWLGELEAWLATGSDELLGGRKTDAETLRRLAELGYLDEEQ